jgi:ATPase subunit of ABC transporter with duplicated ATPase domains
MSESKGVATLLKFAFSYEQVHQSIDTLSGGERSRLQMLRIMLSEPNLLLLDEPTNNLDIASAESLEKALDEFQGAIFIISHDRYFLDQAIDEIVEIKEGKLRSYLGGYTDYLAASDNNL